MSYLTDRNSDRNCLSRLFPLIYHFFVQLIRNYLFSFSKTWKLLCNDDTIITNYKPFIKMRNSTINQHCYANIKCNILRIRLIHLKLRPVCQIKMPKCNTLIWLNTKSIWFHVDSIQPQQMPFMPAGMPQANVNISFHVCANLHNVKSSLVLTLFPCIPHHSNQPCYNILRLASKG